MPLQEPGAERLMALCAEFRRRSSLDPGLTAEAFCAEHPLEADRLRPLLAVTEFAASQAPEEPQLDPRFRLLRLLGGGGFGKVWCVEDEQFSKRGLIALKHLRSDQPQLADYLVEEIETMRLVAGHPGVPRIIDSFNPPGGLPYFTMEYIEGASLEAVLQASAPLEIHRALRLLHEILDVLHHIHERGIIHRDLKPNNIMLVNPGTDEEHIKLIDFGVSMRMALKRGDVTRFQDDGYKPPELLSPDDDERIVDQSTDLYALGVIAAHMLVRVPARGSPRQAIQSSPLIDADIKDFVLALLSERGRRPASAVQATRWLNIVRLRRLPWWTRLRERAAHPGVKTVLLAVPIAAAGIVAWKLAVRPVPKVRKLFVTVIDQNNRSVGNLAIFAVDGRDTLAVTSESGAAGLEIPTGIRALRIADRRTPPCYEADSPFALQESDDATTKTLHVRNTCAAPPVPVPVPPPPRPKPDTAVTKPRPPWQKTFVISVFPPDARVLLGGKPVATSGFGRGSATLTEGKNAFDITAADLHVELSYTLRRDDPNTKIILDVPRNSIRGER